MLTGLWFSAHISALPPRRKFVTVDMFKKGTKRSKSPDTEAPLRPIDMISSSSGGTSLHGGTKKKACASHHSTGLVAAKTSALRSSRASEGTASCGSIDWLIVHKKWWINRVSTIRLIDHWFRLFLITVVVPQKSHQLRPPRNPQFRSVLRPWIRRTCLWKCPKSRGSPHLPSRRD